MSVSRHRVRLNTTQENEASGGPIITVRINEKAGGVTDRRGPSGKLRLLETNAGIFHEIVPQIDAVAPESMVLVVTDPPDPLADVVRILGHERVLSTASTLDSLRLRFHVARRLKVNPAYVEAQVLGDVVQEEAAEQETPEQECSLQGSRSTSKCRRLDSAKPKQVG